MRASRRAPTTDEARLPRRRRTSTREWFALGRPIRTCVGCGARDRQAALVRVALHAGRLRLDPARHLAGRGAYLHARATCRDAFVRRDGFVRSLRAVIAKAERDAFGRCSPEVHAWS